MQPHGILVFPEGHRTRDGEIQPFHTAGLEIMLRERPLPVYVVVTDGFWTCRRFVDFLWNMDRIDGRTEVLGPFDPPADGEYAAVPAKGCARRWSSPSAADARRRGCGRLRRCGQAVAARVRPAVPRPDAAAVARAVVEAGGERRARRRLLRLAQDEGAAGRLQRLRPLRGRLRLHARSTARCARTAACATVRPSAPRSTPGCRRTRSRSR